MNIHKLRIEGFKSIGKIELIEPNPFTVFVGPNAAGKSNIFEALEFCEMCNNTIPQQVISEFGKGDEIVNQNIKSDVIKFFINIGRLNPELAVEFRENSLQKWTYNQYGSMFEITNPTLLEALMPHEIKSNKTYSQPEYLHLTNFTRLFINEQAHKVKRKNQDNSRLSSDASNLEKVLKRILQNENNAEEIVELLQLLIPGFENVEIRTEELSGSDSLLIYESALKKPLSKRLISDGTYNILSLISAVYQSDSPQFLCIEEPENGLNPKVVRQLVSFFRDKCREKGHYIWLNTHSQTLVSELTPDEIVLVDKVNGNTEIKQIKGMDLHGLTMDEALLTNALGGGIPW